MWGSNLWLPDREPHAPPTEPTRCPRCFYLMSHHVVFFVVAPFYSPTNSAPVFLQLCQHLFFFVFLFFRAILIGVSWYLVIVLILHFHNYQWCWTYFHVLIGHLFIFIGEISIQVLCPFLNQIVWFLLLSFRSTLYSLDSNPLSDIRFSSIFSHFMGCLFILLIVSFDE